MKTIVEMGQAVEELVGKFFKGTKQMDRLFDLYDTFEQMVIWSTYPELLKSEVDRIQEMLLNDATAEEILEEMSLEDREDKIQEHMYTLTDMPEEMWEDYVEEQVMNYYNPGIAHEYRETKDFVDMIMEGKGRRELNQVVIDGL